MTTIPNAILLLVLAATAVSATLSPDQAVWVEHESATVARVGHQLFHEAGGEGFVAQGGFSYGAANPNVSAFGPSTPLSPFSFERTEAATSFPAAYGHAGARWRNAPWYMLHGGVSSPGSTPSDASVYLYDRGQEPPVMVTLHAVENGTAAAPPLVHHQMTFAGNHSYIVGGRMQDGSVSATVYAISSVDPASSSVSWAAVDASDSGFGGRYGHCVVPYLSYIGVEMLVIGGFGADHNMSTSIHTLYQADSDGLVFSGIAGSMTPFLRAYHTCAAFPRSGITTPGVVVFGGVNDMETLPDAVHVYDADVLAWTTLNPSVASHLADSGFMGHGARFLAQAYASTVAGGVRVTVHGGGSGSMDTTGANDLSTLYVSLPSAVACPVGPVPFFGEVAACAFNGTRDPLHACDCLSNTVGTLQGMAETYPDCHEVGNALSVLQDMQDKSCFAGQANCTQLYLGVHEITAGCENTTSPEERCSCSTSRADEILPWWDPSGFDHCPLNDQFISLTGCSGDEHFCYPDEQGAIHECEMLRGPWAFTCRNATLGIMPCPGGHVYDGRSCVPFCP